MLLFTREAVRAIDKAAADEYGLPGVVLMENAARAVADEALHVRTKRGLPGPVILICGTGNNGGDGLAAARLLHNARVAVRIVLIGVASRVRGDARIQITVAERMRLPMVSDLPVSARGCVVVDALFGTGLDRPLEGVARAAVEWMNEQSAAPEDDRTRIVAVDLPSGMDCDTGEPLGGLCVRADSTVTFCGPKSGFRNPGAASWLGRVVVGDIGAPRELLERFGTPLTAPCQ